MSKLQTVCLWFTILAALNYAIHVLLGFDLLYAWIKDDSLASSLYALAVGISAFIDITLFSKQV